MAGADLGSGLVGLGLAWLVFVMSDWFGLVSSGWVLFSLVRLAWVWSGFTRLDWVWVGSIRLAWVEFVTSLVFRSLSRRLDFGDPSDLKLIFFVVLKLVEISYLYTKVNFYRVYPLSAIKSKKGVSCFNILQDAEKPP